MAASTHYRAILRVQICGLDLNVTVRPKHK